MAVARAAVSCRAYFTTTVPGLFSHTLRFPCISFSLAAPVVRVYIRRASCTPCSSMASPTSSAAGVKITAPYGTWKSPITSDVVSGAEKRLGGFAVAGDGRLLWVESRPQEGGRSVLVIESEQEGDKPIDVISPDFSVRTLAQEYGGGSFAVSGSTVIFSNYKDQRLYKQVIGEGAPVPLTPDYGGAVSYADGVFDSKFDRYITVMEDRRKDTLQPTSTIAAIDIKDGKIQEPKPLIGGNDFYAFPRIDPTGTRMAWIEWCHPNMPWDRAELWVGYFSENGDLIKRICIAGNDPGSVESASEPKWSPQGELFFITDKRNGFWNIHKWVESQNEVVPMYSLDAEFTRPLWVFGISSYDFIQKDGKNCRIACSYRKGGKSYIGTLDPTSSSFSFLDNVPFTDIGNVLSDRDCLYIEGASAMQPLSIARVKLDDSSKTAKYAIVWSSSLDCMKYLPYFSTPEVVEFPTEVQGKSAYAYFYPPSNSEYMANDDEKPPLLLKSHGGPTAESRGILNLYIQYWTSRGWAFVDVNYGGSTGYGREYRERLIGSWGITDVNDCCSCAKFLVDNGKVDGNRLCIMGGSAGGYTTLAALAFKDTFKAGASLYGVADLALLKAETHKFESHYIDNLVGSEVAYVERSPINFVERFTCPVILFQGLEDKVVPPIQARTIYQALKGRNIPVALVEYEGEQHGFRKAENIKFTLEQQMVFFARLVGKFKVADDINPVKIDNFDQL